MVKSFYFNGLLRKFALGCVLVVFPVVAGAETFERSFTFDADELRVGNLIGHVQVTGHDGKDILVRVVVDGRDATQELIQIEADSGRRAELVIRFPLEDHRRFVYPPLGRGRTRFRARHGDDGWLTDILSLGGREIEVRGESFRDAVEMWADVEIQMPRDRAVAVYLGVGAMEGLQVRGDLNLDTRSGKIRVEGLTGELRADTGSGSIEVADVTGEVDIDTGSGRVDVQNVHGAERVRIDTGSGSVEARSIEAHELLIDTGSGGVDVTGIRVEELSIDTGSGGIDAFDVEADGAVIDTGSGSVELELLRMGSGRYEIDTGSGGIRMRVPKSVSAVFVVDTGSGSIQVDVDGVAMTRKKRTEARFTVGSGESRVELSTGSGSIRISHSRAG